MVADEPDDEAQMIIYVLTPDSILAALRVMARRRLK